MTIGIHMWKKSGTVSAQAERLAQETRELEHLHTLQLSTSVAKMEAELAQLNATAFGIQAHLDSMDASHKGQLRQIHHQLNSVLAALPVVERSSCTVLPADASVCEEAAPPLAMAGEFRARLSAWAAPMPFCENLDADSSYSESFIAGPPAVPAMNPIRKSMASNARTSSFECAGITADSGSPQKGMSRKYRIASIREEALELEAESIVQMGSQMGSQRVSLDAQRVSVDADTIGAVFEPSPQWCRVRDGFAPLPVGKNQRLNATIDLSHPTSSGRADGEFLGGRHLSYYLK